MFVVLQKALPVRTGSRAPAGTPQKGHVGYQRTVRGKAQAISQRGVVTPPQGPVGNPHARMWGHLDLAKLPPATVPSSDVEFNVDGNVDTNWALRWKHPETGDWQYGYTKKYFTLMGDEKHKHVRKVADHLKKLDKIAAGHAVNSKQEKERVLGLMVWLATQEYFRPSDEEVVQKSGTYGLSTFRVKHLKIAGDKATFKFVGKAGVPWERTVKCGPKLIKELKRLTKHKGKDDNLFSFTKDTGRVQPIRSTDLRDYMDEHAHGAAFKDLRTYHGTRMADEAVDRFLAKKPQVDGDPDKWTDKQFRTIVGGVSDRLGNEAATAEKYYVADWVKDKLATYAAKKVSKSLDYGDDRPSPEAEAAVESAWKDDQAEVRELGAPLGFRHVKFLKRLLGSKGYAEIDS